VASNSSGDKSSEVSPIILFKLTLKKQSTIKFPANNNDNQIKAFLYLHLSQFHNYQKGWGWKCPPSFREGALVAFI